MISWYSLKNSILFICFFRIISSFPFLSFGGTLTISNGSLISEFLYSTNVTSQKCLNSLFCNNHSGNIDITGGGFPFAFSLFNLSASILNFYLISSFFLNIYIISIWVIHVLFTFDESFDDLSTLFAHSSNSYVPKALIILDELNLNPIVFEVSIVLARCLYFSLQGKLSTTD